MISQNVYLIENIPPYIGEFGNPVPKNERGRIVLPVRTKTKVGNNQVCSCGSGKKYKKCCK